MAGQKPLPVRRVHGVDVFVASDDKEYAALVKQGKLVYSQKEMDLALANPESFDRITTEKLFALKHKLKSVRVTGVTIRGAQ